MRSETTRFLDPYKSGGDLHVRLGSPVLSKKLDEVMAKDGAGAACALAQSALEQADLSPRARAAAQKFLAQHGAIVAPSLTRHASAKRFEYRMKAAEGDDSPGSERILKGEVKRTIEDLKGKRVPRKDIRHSLANPNLSNGAFQALQDFLATGRLREKGEEYSREASGVIGDRFLFVAKGAKDAAELEIVGVKRGKQRVEVEGKYGSKFGGIVNVAAYTYEVRAVGGDPAKTWKLDGADLAAGKMLRGSELEGAGVSAELAAKYGAAPGEWVFEDYVHPSVSLEKIGDKDVLRVGGRVFTPGDGARIHIYLDGEDRYHECEMSIRAIRAGKDARPEVIVDEFVSPGRLRTRKLLPGELGLLAREPFYSKFVDAYREPMPELQVVTYPKKAPGIYGERQAFRVKDDVFTTGDDALVDVGGKKLGARILTIDAGEYPKVLVKLETGEARELTKQEVASLELDQLALLERTTHGDPRPDLEVIRVAGRDPFLLMGDERVKAGDFVVFDRCSPGVIPMIVDRIEQKNGKDVVWIKELMPLAEDGPKVHETVEFFGRKVEISYESWPEGSKEREQGLPAIMTYTRPLGWFEYHLMKTEKDRRSEIHESDARTKHMEVREHARFERYELLKERNPKLAAKLFDEHDAEVFARRGAYKAEKQAELGHFNLEDLGWALSRSHSGLHYGPGNQKILMLRDTKIERGSGLVYRRDDQEIPMKVLEVVEGTTVRVSCLEDGKLVMKSLAKQDNLFLFPDADAPAKIDQMRRRARAEKMLAVV